MQFYEALQQEAAFLTRLIENSSKNRRHCMDGSLHVSQSAKGTISYYHYQEKTKDKYPNGKYIPKKEWSKAQKLAQKEYDEDVYLYAVSRLKIIQNLIDTYDHQSLSSLFHDCKEGRRKLIIPYGYEPDFHLSQWENTVYTSNPYYPEKKIHLTHRGEYVRSKSEKIIADRYFQEGIPYRYEPELKLNKRTVYPDFQVLNPRTGQEFYHEHLGMMSDPQYSADSLIKIEEYVKNGIYPGEKLLFTAETTDHVFDEEILDKLIEHYLK